MNESEQMNQKLSASQVFPRIKTLDFGDSFSSTANLLRDMSIGEVSKGEVEHCTLRCIIQYASFAYRERYEGHAGEV